MDKLGNLLRSQEAAKMYQLHFHLEMRICEFNGVSGQHGKRLLESCKIREEFLVESQ